MSLKLLAVAALVAGLAGTPGTVSAQTAAAPAAPTAHDFAREAAISAPVMSPDGSRLAAIISPDGIKRYIAVWDTAHLEAAPYVIAPGEGIEPIQLRFVKKDRLFVTVQQLINFDISGRAERSYAYVSSIIDLQGHAVRLALDFDGLTPAQQIRVGVGRLISTLPRDEENILVQNPVNGDIFRLNLYTGRPARVERGSDEFQGQTADLDGNIRAESKFDYDNGAAFIAQYIKNPATGRYEEYWRNYARDREGENIVAWTTDPNIILVSSNRGREHTAIFEYDLRTKHLGEVAFEHPLFDATGVIQSRDPAHFGEILGFTYDGAQQGEVYWVNDTLSGVSDGLRAAMGVETVPVPWTDNVSGQRTRFRVGDGVDVSIGSRSDDLTKLIVERSGPTTPPEYYVLVNGRPRLLGRAYPEIYQARASLGTTTLVQYPARDGLLIPAFVTKPNPAVWGAGPYPTIVVPHGGPWARDDLGWDQSGWTQYFAARGYAVLQPEFRGSNGWGQRLWRAGDRQWGQAMQDDVDDGARWMIDQHLSTAGRIAVHGYSYGGYVAMMAAVRPNGLYACSIAGAGPSSLALFRRGTYNSRYLREFQHPTAEGVDPVAHVNEVSIPIFLYHGDRDTNVIPRESETFAGQLRSAGKTVRFRLLPDMEHTINTWSPANFEAILSNVDDYLRTECKPGGL